jgi:hypothetical protein
MPASFVETGIIFYPLMITGYRKGGVKEIREVKEVKAICFTAKYTSLKDCWL